MGTLLYLELNADYQLPDAWRSQVNPRLEPLLGRRSAARGDRREDRPPTHCTLVCPEHLVSGEHTHTGVAREQTYRGSRACRERGGVECTYPSVWHGGCGQVQWVATLGVTAYIYMTAYDLGALAC